MARLTHKVSVLSRGILALKTTLVGVVQVDPRKLLEEASKIHKRFNLPFVCMSRQGFSLIPDVSLLTGDQTRIGNPSGHSAPQCDSV